MHKSTVTTRMTSYPSELMSSPVELEVAPPNFANVDATTPRKAVTARGAFVVACLLPMVVRIPVPNASHEHVGTSQFANMLTVVM